MTIRGQLWAAAAILAVLAGYGCGGERAAPPPVAVVNGHEIAAADLERELASLSRPPTPAERRRALGLLINRRLLLDQAEKEGIESLPDVQAALRSQRDALLIDRLLEKHFGPALSVSPDEVIGFYRSNPDFFALPERRRIRQIVTAEEWEAAKIQERLMANGDFRTLAQDHSILPPSARVGDLGYVVKKDLDPLLAGPAFSLATGAASSPIQSRLGYHVLEVTDIRPSRQLSFAESSGAIRNYLTVSRQEKLIGGWLAELKAAAEVEVPGEPGMISDLKSQISETGGRE